MESVLAIHGFQLIVICSIYALIITWATAPREITPVPTWPTRCYLCILRTARLAGSREYADSRTVFSRREQFMTGFAVWLTILMFAAIFVLASIRDWR